MSKLIKITKIAGGAIDAEAQAKVEAELAAQPPTAEERLEALEAAFIELVGVMYND